MTAPLTGCPDTDCPSAKECVRSPESGRPEAHDQEYWWESARGGTSKDCVYFIPTTGLKLPKKGIR